jgi:hypothetical protein
MAMKHNRKGVWICWRDKELGALSVREVATMVQRSCSSRQELHSYINF